MNIYKKDYSKLYRLQIKFLNWLQELDLPFYLTGGTALARFPNRIFEEHKNLWRNAGYTFTTKQINRNNE
jgi:hypothetical protein